VGRSGWVTGACAFSQSTKAASSCPAAYLDRARPEALTKYALVKKAALREAVLSVRKLGYATTDQELEIGLRSIAVPVMDSHGAVVAAMSASASSARVSLAQMVKSFLPGLRANAAGLGRLLTSAAG
jgi:IclR family pca regulon transcriptional regulator